MVDSWKLYETLFLATDKKATADDDNYVPESVRKMLGELSDDDDHPNEKPAGSINHARSLIPLLEPIDTAIFRAWVPGLPTQLTHEEENDPHNIGRDDNLSEVITVAEAIRRGEFRVGNGFVDIGALGDFIGGFEVGRS